jgi:two-component sensor histidine kinase
LFITINAAIRSVDLIKRNAELERYKSIHALVTTINHRINNPLAIAFGMLGDKLEDLNEEKYHSVRSALERIHSVVSKIDSMTDVDITYEAYSEHVNMLKID